MKKLFLLFSLFSALFFFTGCATKSEFVVQPLLEKQEPKGVTLYLREIECSPKNKVQGGGAIFKKILENELAYAGYIITDNVEEANYSIEGVVLKSPSFPFFVYKGQFVVKFTLQRGENPLFENIYESDKVGMTQFKGILLKTTHELLYSHVSKICAEFTLDVDKGLMQK